MPNTSPARHRRYQHLYNRGKILMILLGNFCKSCKTRQKLAAERVKEGEPDKILGGVKSVTKRTRIFVLLDILQKLVMESKFNALGLTSSASFVRRSETFWRTVIADITDPKDIFRVTRWIKPSQQLQPPPIHAWRRSLHNEPSTMPTSYARRNSKDGTFQTISQIHGPHRSHQPDKSLSRHTSPTSEAQDALLRTGNTTPGMDGITTKMLQAIWPSISHVTTLLYNACLTLGYHPDCLQNSRSCDDPKNQCKRSRVMSPPGAPSPSSPACRRAWSV